MGKKSRMKRNHGLRPKQPSGVPGSKPNFPKKVSAWVTYEAGYKPISQISRREALKRGVVAAASIAAGFGLGKFFERRIARWIVPDKSHSIFMQFGRHASAVDALSLINKMERSRAAGKRVHIFLEENAASTLEHLPQNVRNSNSDLDLIYNDYLFLLKTRSPTQALGDLRVKYNQIYPKATEFVRDIDLYLAINRIRKFQLEIYAGKESAEMKQLNDKWSDNELNFQKVVKEGLSLSALQKQNLEQQSTLSRGLVIRNNHIMQNIESGRLFDLAKKYFPELEKENNLVAFGHLGSGHRAIIAELDHSKSKVLVEELPFVTKYSLQKYVALAFRPGQQPDEHFARINAIGEYFDRNVPQMINQNGEAAVARAYRKALRITQEEFESMSRQADAIPDMLQKTTFILNYFLGKR